MMYPNIRIKDITFYTFSYSRPADPLTVGPSFFILKFFKIFFKKYLLFFDTRAIITESLVKQ